MVNSFYTSNMNGPKSFKHPGKNGLHFMTSGHKKLKNNTPWNYISLISHTQALQRSDCFNHFWRLYRQLAIYNMSHYTFHLYHEIYLCSTFYCTLFKASCIIVRKEAVIKVVTKHCSLGALIEKQICVAKTTDFSCMKKYATTYKNVKTFQGLL